MEQGEGPAVGWSWGFQPIIRCVCLDICRSSCVIQIHGKTEGITDEFGSVSSWHTSFVKEKKILTTRDTWEVHTGGKQVWDLL